MPDSHKNSLTTAQWLITCGSLLLALAVSLLLPSSLPGQLAQFGVWFAVAPLILRAWSLRSADNSRSTGSAALLGIVIVCWLGFVISLSAQFVVPVVFEIVGVLCVVARIGRAQFTLWKNRTPAPTKVSLSLSADPPVCPVVDIEFDEEFETFADETDDIDAALEQRLLSTTVGNQTDGEARESEEPVSRKLTLSDPHRQIFQRYERGVGDDGSEWLEGMLLVELSHRQKTAIVHLPFWPAFSSLPRIESELLAGPDLRIEIKTVQRWGIRIELTRKARHLDPDSAELAFFVNTRAAIKEAA